jgi:hypothetical protein
MNRARQALLALLILAAMSTNAKAQLLARPTLGVFGGVTTPRGDFQDEVSNGWNAGVLIKARLYRALDIRLDGAYSKLGEKTVIIPVNNLEDTVIFHTDGTLPFGTLNVHANLGPDSAEYPGDNTVTPHVLAGIGIYELDYKLTCAGPCEGFETVPKQKHMGLNVGGGATVPVFGVRMFFEARYHRISRKPEDGDARTLITVSAGLRIR